MEIKVDTVICLQMEKTSKVKTPPGDFKVTTPENLLLSKQTERNPSTFYQPIVEPLSQYPNTQLDLFCSDNLSF